MHGPPEAALCAVETVVGPPEALQRATEALQRALEALRRAPEALHCAPEALQRAPEPLQRAPEPLAGATPTTTIKLCHYSRAEPQASDTPQSLRERAVSAYSVRFKGLVDQLRASWNSLLSWAAGGPGVEDSSPEPSQGVRRVTVGK